MTRSFRHLLLAAAVISMASASQSFATPVGTYSGAGGPLVDGSFDGDNVNTGSAFFDISVSGTGATVDSIQSVTVTNLTHTFIGDTGIYLIGPDGASYSVLESAPNGEPSNFNGTYTFVVDPNLPTVDESIIGHDTDYDLPSGTYAASDYGDGVTAGPRSDFSALSGQSLDGTWTLEIDDYYPGDTGTLGSWSFAVNTVATPEPTSIAVIGLLGTLARRRRA